MEAGAEDEAKQPPRQLENKGRARMMIMAFDWIELKK